MPTPTATTKKNRFVFARCDHLADYVFDSPYDMMMEL